MSVSFLQRKRRGILVAVALALGLAGLFVLHLSAAQDLDELTRITTASDSSRGSGNGYLSAGGRWIAFNSDSDFLSQGIPYGQYEVWLYDTESMTVTRVTTASHSGRNSYLGDISADGRWVTFYSDSDFLSQGIPSGQYEIWLYDATAGRLTRVTTATDGDRTSRLPVLSGNGRYVAFDSDSDLLNQGIPEGQFEIWLYDTTAMTLTRVTTATSSDRDSSEPALSADGRYVAFRSDSDFLGHGVPAGKEQIWLYDTVAMTYTRVTSATDDACYSYYPNLNGDGTLVAFISRCDLLETGVLTNRLEVWLYDTQAVTFTRVTYTADAGWWYSDPWLSDDGRFLTFHAAVDPLNGGTAISQTEIWLYDTVAQTITRETWGDETCGSLFPRISPDGTRVAFYSWCDFLNEGITTSELWVKQVSYRVYLPYVRKD